MATEEKGGLHVEKQGRALMLCVREVWVDQCGVTTKSHFLSPSVGRFSVVHVALKPEGMRIGCGADSGFLTDARN